MVSRRVDARSPNFGEMLQILVIQSCFQMCSQIQACFVVNAGLSYSKLENNGLSNFFKQFFTFYNRLRIFHSFQLS